VVVSAMVQMLAPLAPHFSEEAWRRLGHSQSVFHSGWPQADSEALLEPTVILAIQVNGKLRGQVSVPAGLDEESVVRLAKADPRVSRFIADADVVKTVFVPGRLLNLVVRSRA